MKIRNDLTAAKRSKIKNEKKKKPNETGAVLVFPVSICTRYNKYTTAWQWLSGRQYSDVRFLLLFAIWDSSFVGWSRMACVRIRNVPAAGRAIAVAAVAAIQQQQPLVCSRVHTPTALWPHTFEGSVCVAATIALFSIFFYIYIFPFRWEEEDDRAEWFREQTISAVCSVLAKKKENIRVSA